MYDTTSELYNDFLGIYFDKYNKLPDANRNKIEPKYDPNNLFLGAYNYDKWFEMKNQLIKQGKVIKKNLTCHHKKLMKKK